MPDSPADYAPAQNYREAHKQGRVWLTFKLSGGAVRWGKTSFGKIEGAGPKTAEQGYAIYLLSLGLSPLEVHKQMAEKGYVYKSGKKRGEYKPSTAVAP